MAKQLLKLKRLENNNEYRCNETIDLEDLINEQNKNNSDIQKREAGSSLRKSDKGTKQ